MNDRVVFLSDAHLGAERPAAEREREGRLIAWLDALPGRAGELVIVGDLFDFWFEYRNAIPRRLFPTLAALQRLTAAGVQVRYLPGNHDFWLGRFFDDELGVRTESNPLVLERQGRRIWIHHGDGLLRGDLGYRVLRRVVRHPWSVGLYQLLHPDLGLPLAHAVSGWSRHSRAERPLDEERLWRGIAMPAFAQGCDAVVLGHFHQPLQVRRDQRDLIVLGDWMRHFTWAELCGGRLSLEWANGEAGSVGAAG